MCRSKLAIIFKFTNVDYTFLLCVVTAQSKYMAIVVLF